MARQGVDPIKMRSQQRREALRPKSSLADIAEAAYAAKKAHKINAKPSVNLSKARLSLTKQKN